MKPEIKKLLILNLPYLLFVWLFDKVGAAVRLSPGADASAKLLHLGDGFSAAFSSIAPSFHPADLLIGIAGAVIVRLIIYVKGKNAKKYRKGMEYGSARWGTAEDIKPYTDPVFENNIPLTQTERLTMNSRPKQPKYARNKNILVIGGSGSGKTRFFVKPSLMQMHSSYVVTDPKGTVLIECGKLLQRGGYQIKVLNTINFKKSMKYKALDAQYAKEQDALEIEIAELEKAVTGYEQSQKSAEKFIALIDKYENFDTLTNTMLNEFVEKILVHERSRKGSQDTTQEIEIYFNFLGRYIPPSLQPVPLTPEEQEELRKREERKDRLHQNYLKRKASGAQKQYEDKIKAKKKAEMDAKKALIRAEDMKKGVFSTIGQLPKEEPRKGSIAASAAV